MARVSVSARAADPRSALELCASLPFWGWGACPRPGASLYSPLPPGTPGPFGLSPRSRSSPPAFPRFCLPKSQPPVHHRSQLFLLRAPGGWVGEAGGRATPPKGPPPPPASSSSSTSSLSSPPPPRSDAASLGRVFGGQRPPQAGAPQRFL